MRVINVILLICLLLSNVLSSKDRWDTYRSEWPDLMLAIYNDEQDEVIQLIEDGAEVNFSTLDVSIRKQNLRALEILISADQITINADEKVELFISACMYESREIVAKLHNFGCDINDTYENGYSPLMAAASFGSINTLEYLLINNANVEQIRTVDGYTALMFATHNGNLSKVELLLKYGADKSIENKNGKRAYDLIDGIYDRFNVDDITKQKLKELLL